MKEGVNDRKDEKNDKTMRKKRQNALMKIPFFEMEEGLSDRKYYRNEKMMSKKRHNAQMTLTLLRWRKV